ncbi:mechanosensitive ion channel [Novosphingobium sp. G106]|uniref:mechanosensitive ion channel family protein n=1 Tax=Novosphingobium sp. G106 TaxID=2849500 RepID=UPI001C2CEE21|nr:mechanosensitive ion channel domain-containing protein [Novosphingobium sp. G106]MBV1691354.1 mechanosensitive ion channel [Novosphingobium sp. G106]
MDWQEWVSHSGLSLSGSFDLEALVVAGILAVGALAIGWIVGRRAGPWLSERIHLLGGSVPAGNRKTVTGIVQCSVAGLLLLVAGNSVALSPLGLTLLAVTLGMVTGVLSIRVARALAVGRMPARIVGLGVLVATTAAALGGMRPLIEGLDSVGFSIGTHRLSLLGTVNAIVIIAVLYGIARIVNHVVSHVIDRVSGLDLSQRVLIRKLSGIGVITIAVLLGIDLLGIDLTALTVFSGAVGLAIGFGLQKTFGNLIAGLILLMDRSVKPGDVIVVGDTFGAVGKIGVRAVSVLTRDGKEHLIPNEQLMTEPVENWSYTNRNVRIHVPVGVAYSSDLALARRLMIEAASAAARVLAEPGPSVWLKGFGDSSVDHEILVWIADPELGVGSVRSEILNRLWMLFAENHIEIPFPQRDIHVRSVSKPETD